MAENINEILENLSSPTWAQRTKAHEQLTLLRDKEDILFLFKKIWKEKDVSHTFSFFRLQEILLSEKNINLVALGLFCLYHFKDYENLKIRAESTKMIDNFFDSPTVYRYIKVAAIRHCWSMVPLSRRYHLTKTIGERNFFELIPAVLTNFDYKDKELNLLSIEVIRKLEDPRGIRFLKQICRETKDLEILEASLLALGRVGHFFEGFFFISYLTSKNEQIANAGIVGISQLLQGYSIKYLKKLYYSTDSKNIKNKIIENIGQVEHHNSGKFLIELYKFETDGNIALKIEWAMQELNKKNIIPYLIKLFNNSSDKLRFKILTFFGEIYDEACFKLLLQVLKGKYSNFIVASALDSISIYNDPNAALFIEKIALDTDNPLSYYALTSLYHHESYNHEKLIFKFIDLDVDLNSPNHQIIFNIIRGKKNSFSEDHRLIKYIEKTLSSEVNNNTYLAIECAATVFSREIFKRLLYISHQTKNTFIEKTCVEAIIKIISKNPEIIKEHPDVLVDERILNKFKPYKMKKEFLFTFLSTVEDVGWDHYQGFIHIFGGYIAENVKNYLKSWRSVNELSQMLKFLNRIGAHSSYETIEYLIEEVYDSCNEENQFLILNMAASFSHIDFLNFVVNESLHRKEFVENGHALVEKYIKKVGS